MIDVFLVGHDPHFLQVDADIGQVFGNEADVLVLGAPGQDFIADHEYAGGDDLTHLDSPPAADFRVSHRYARRLWRTQRIEVTSFCRIHGQMPARFAGRSTQDPANCPQAMHIALAQPLLPSV